MGKAISALAQTAASVTTDRRTHSRTTRTDTNSSAPRTRHGFPYAIESRVTSEVDDHLHPESLL